MLGCLWYKLLLFIFFKVKISHRPILEPKCGWKNIMCAQLSQQTEVVTYSLRQLVKSDLVIAHSSKSRISITPHGLKEYINYINFLKFIFREGKEEREREALICCSTYLYIHWLMLVRALTGAYSFNTMLW